MQLNSRQFVSELRSRARGDMGRAVISTFVARGITSLGSVLLVAVIGRFYGASGVGVYALAQSMLMAANILACYGRDKALMRFVGRDLSSSHVAVYFRRAGIKILITSVVAAGIIFFGRSLWSQLFNAPQLAPVLVGFAVATPAFTLAFYLAGFMKSVRKPALSTLLQNGAIALVATVWIMVVGYVWSDAGIASIGIAYALAAWLVLGFGLWRCRQWFRHTYQPATQTADTLDLAGFNRSSSSFFIISLSQLLTMVGSIWVGGYFLSTAALGLYKAAQQLSQLISFILIVLNAIFPPRFAALYHEGKRKALAQLARHGVHLGIAMAAIPVLACLFVPGYVLLLVGDDFSGAVNLLRILAFAQFINVSCGSVGSLLNMSGHERLTRNVTLVSGSVALICMAVFIPLMGAIALAVAVGLNLVVKNCANVYLVWTRLGVWTLPLPNVLAALGVTTRARLATSGRRT